MFTVLACPTPNQFVVTIRLRSPSQVPMIKEWLDHFCFPDQYTWYYVPGSSVRRCTFRSVQLALYFLDFLDELNGS